MIKKFSIGVIGSGKVATQLARAFQKKGNTIAFVLSKNVQHARTLADKLGVNAIEDKNLIVHYPIDFLLIAINDDQIEGIIEALPRLTNKETTVIHTSGTVSSEVSKGKFENYGVLYPLQTFSKERKMKFKKVPFCVVGNRKGIQNKIEALARTVSHNVYKINDADRFIVHIAAVIACNFSNYMYSIADDLLRTHQLPFEILKPLIKETAQKVMHGEPNAVQTGPAKRGDQETIRKHLKFLDENPELQKLYSLLSEGISSKYQES